MTNLENKNKIHFKKLSNRVKVALLAGTMVVSMSGCSSCGANHIEDPVEIVVETQDPEVVEPVVTPEPEVVEPVVTPEPEVIEDEITYEELITAANDFKEYANSKFIYEWGTCVKLDDATVMSTIFIANAEHISAETINQLIENNYISSDINDIIDNYKRFISNCSLTSAINTKDNVEDGWISLENIFLNEEDKASYIEMDNKAINDCNNKVKITYTADKDLENNPQINKFIERQYYDLLIVSTIPDLYTNEELMANNDVFLNEIDIMANYLNTNYLSIENTQGMSK